MWQFQRTVFERKLAAKKNSALRREKRAQHYSMATSQTVSTLLRS